MMALPFFTEGGAERIFAALAREWRRQGVKVVVVTTLALAPESPNRLDVLRRETPYVYPLAGILEGREDRMADFVYFLLRRHRIRLVYMAGCDLMYRLLPQIRQEFPHIAVVDQLFNDEVHFHSNRAFCDFIDCTVVPGRKIAEKLVREYREKESRIAVIPHGVALPAAEGSPGVRPPALPPGFENKPLVCFFGRWSAEKAPLDFVNIAALVRSRFPQARFVMTGDGPEKKAVEQAIRRRALGRDLLLPGFVEDVQPWIAAAGVVVVPSRLDGMPLIVFEAQGLGKPVVASRTGSIPEVIEDGVTGVLREPGDIEGFAAAVCRLLEDGECRKRIGEAARTYAWREHRQEVMLERYYRLFERWMPAGQGARR
jgi:glycosyltransferase involved in cell wall biosynthesis